MPDYTSVSLREGLRDRIEEMKQRGDTYSDVIDRALANQPPTRDNIDKRLSYNQALLEDMCKVVGELAEAQDIPAEDLPGNVAERVKHDEPSTSSMFRPHEDAFYQSDDEQDTVPWEDGDNEGDSQ